MKTDFHVDDIYHDRCRRIFVLESPHVEELRTGFPASGATGEVMSAALHDKREPLGIVISKGIIVSDGLVNAFQFPLSTSVYSEIPSSFRPFTSLKDLPYSNPQSYKSELKSKISQANSISVLNDFKSRIDKAVESTAVKEIVVCGFISQAVWELAFKGKSPIGFRTWSEVEIAGKNLNLRYTTHPSPRGGRNWEL